MPTFGRPTMATRITPSSAGLGLARRAGGGATMRSEQVSDADARSGGDGMGSPTRDGGTRASTADRSGRSDLVHHQEAVAPASSWSERAMALGPGRSLPSSRPPSGARRALASSASLRLADAGGTSRPTSDDRGRKPPVSTSVERPPVPLGAREVAVAGDPRDGRPRPRGALASMRLKSVDFPTSGRPRWRQWDGASVARRSWSEWMRRVGMERATGFEPTTSAWEADTPTAELCPPARTPRPREVPRLSACRQIAYRIDIRQPETPL